LGDAREIIHNSHIVAKPLPVLKLGNIAEVTIERLHNVISRQAWWRCGVDADPPKLRFAMLFSMEIEESRISGGWMEVFFDFFFVIIDV
jgi:hypothetical protein